jgi:hypothetical protein
MDVSLRFLAIFTILSSPSYSQFLHGKVIDQETREPVPYANILVQEKNAGCISDARGYFTLNLRSAVQSDTIKITCVGYKAFRFLLSSLDVSRPKTFPLVKELRVLKPVIISTAEKTVILGSSTKGKRKTGWGYFHSYRGRTKGLLIQDVVCKSRIKSFNFRIQDNEWDSVAFRLNIQQFGQGKAGETILPENILIITAAKKKWVTVDLRPYNIHICGPIIVSLEWVDSWSTTSPTSSKVLTLSLSKEPGYVFHREVFQELGTLTFTENTPAMYLVVYSE